jgi:hypothetical protein
MRCRCWPSYSSQEVTGAVVVGAESLVEAVLQTDGDVRYALLSPVSILDTPDVGTGTS